MEVFLHYLWEHRLYEGLIPQGILEGCSVEVIDTGLCNDNAGPDFLEAKVRIDDITWVGAVEIHQHAREWYDHGHHNDPAYSGTILHVVEHWDQEISLCNGRPVPCLVMVVPEELRQRATLLISQASTLACAPLNERIPPALIQQMLHERAIERLRHKAQRILQLAQATDWLEALYIILLRYHGFGLNNDAMEQLAYALPYKLLSRYTDSALQFHSLLYGQANLINDLPKDEQRSSLEAEYHFLRNKHQLQPISHTLWKRFRTRPANFPIARLRQVATLLLSRELQPAELLQISTLDELRTYFSTPHSTTADSLIINVALPYQLAWQMEQNKEQDCPQSRILSAIPPERNKIIRLFQRTGIEAHHAGHSQALIQIYQEYCLKHKCLFCNWGRYLLAQKP